MKNTATLGQITKILSLLEGIPSEQVQKVLESGYFASVIRTGDLEEERKRAERKMLARTWGLLGRFTDFEGVFITVPHDPCGHRSDEGIVYQLRCWEGKYGNPTKGHIDGGVDLFEVMLPEQLKDCECCWKNTLNNLGLKVDDTETTEWVKEVREAKDGSRYDLITIHFKTPPKETQK
ncbi:MAG: hypothetical protein NT077_00455 [Candidatus Taylorbacteria bacterium]|nr:hypothetical protein [Candidatus Taylorbacteria bacterium]